MLGCQVGVNSARDSGAKNQGWPSSAQFLVYKTGLTSGPSQVVNRHGGSEFAPYPLFSSPLSSHADQVSSLSFTPGAINLYVAMLTT